MATLNLVGDLVSSNLVSRDQPRRAELHHACTDEFLRPMPPRIRDYLSSFRTDKIPSADEIDNYLAGIRPEVTWAGVRGALLTIGPTIWGYPAVLALTGFYHDRTPAPVPRAYIRIDWRHIEKSERWLRLFDPGFRIGAEPRGYHACGSPNVPPIHELKSFANAVRGLISSSLPDDLIAAVDHYNAAVAGFYLIGAVLLGGMRNWPCAHFNFATSSLGYQKGPMLYEPPQLVKDWIPDWHCRLFELFERCNRSGAAVDQLAFRVAGPALVERVGAAVEIRDFSQRSIAQALFFQADTRRWSGLYPGAMRHFSMTELYAAEFHEHDIERYHHRASSALHPFRLHRLEPAIFAQPRNPMERQLRQILEIP